jgi:catechol 2,3-dioxygenase
MLFDDEAGTARLGFSQPALTLVEHSSAAPRGDTAGLFHVAWLLADRAYLGAALVRLGRAGARLTGAADHHVSEALYLDDPDGHGIELYADRPRGHWCQNGTLILTNTPLDLPEPAHVRESAGVAAESSGDGAALGHLHLEAVDLDASSRFAEEVLGLTMQASWPRARFLGWHGYHHHLAYNDWRRRRHALSLTDERIGLVGFEVKTDDQRDQQVTDPNGVVVRLT